MKMNAQTSGWFIFLVLVKSIDLSWTEKALFELEGSNLTAKEGSCAEINCKVHPNYHSFPETVSSWYWMKDRHYNDEIKDYNATIIYSTDNNSRPVSPDFAGRVTYKGTPSQNWKSSHRQSSSLLQSCSISICNLNKTDNGNYSFRVVENLKKWATNEVNLTVTENPCLITFEKPPVVKENDNVTLTCSTLSSCPSKPQIKGSTELYPKLFPKPLQEINKQKITTVEFKVNWRDDGKTFSCETEDNKDQHLIRKVSLTVEYAPKDVLASVSSEVIKAGEAVTLTCSAKGRPDPKFTWFRDEQKVEPWPGPGPGPGPEMKIDPIKESEGGNYSCVAQNDHGNATSNPVAVDVTYKPHVEVKIPPQDSEVKENTEMNFTCNVIKSHPPTLTYSWYKDGQPISERQQKVWFVQRIQRYDGGSYTCAATNSAGTGTSQPRQIKVQYGPRNTIISIRDSKVQVGKSLYFTCETDAYPAPKNYSWYRNSTNKRLEASQWWSRTTNNNMLNLGLVQRADEACYECSATNDISTEWSSKPQCITVLYPPTNLSMSMVSEITEDPPTNLKRPVVSEITEGHLIRIECTVDSAPPSRLRLTTPSSPDWSLPHCYPPVPPNTLCYIFNVTSAHAGSYTCSANNDIGSEQRYQRKLVVKYRPKDVTVEARPDFSVTENRTLRLTCKAMSHPTSKSYTWMKMTDGKKEIMNHYQTQAITIQSVSPSDSGWYSCAARNEIGTAESKLAQVHVKYAPKYVNVTAAAEQQEPDGRSSVMLTCSSHSYPNVTQYSWYRKMSAKDKKQEKVADRQSYKVPSDKPGYYYCVAENEIDKKSSDPVPLFVHRSLLRALKFVFLSLIILLLILFLVFVYRYKRKKSVHRGQPCFGFMVRWNCSRRRNLIRESVTPEPFRSRDDLLPDQPCRPNAQRHQPRPDSTPASNGNFVYSTVNFPAVKQGPSAQRPVRQQDGHTADDSLSYANIHFGNEKKNKQDKAEVTAVYAVVTKQPKKNEQEDRDYENVSAGQTATSPNPLDSDSDTSDDEVELNYSQVRFEVKPGHQRAVRDSSTSSDSSTSDEEQTQYSDIKI